MSDGPLSCVFLGLSITSTWGNGHATTYRGLIKELQAQGHRVTFLERDVPWYAEHREFHEAPYCDIKLYRSLAELNDRFRSLVQSADVVLVGSYVPDGIAVGEWVLQTARQATVFYDIDTPVTLANLAQGTCEYLRPNLIPQYRLYLSFTGGPTLRFIEQELHSPCAEPLYCSVDPSLYYPGNNKPPSWDLGYLGTYAADRQPTLESLLTNVAEHHPRRHFVVAGPQYPLAIEWPTNVQRLEHVPASEHRSFYTGQRFTLNLTRADMKRAGYSPSVRLFEAAACGVPILTDEWAGLEEFFQPQSEIFPVRTAEQVALCLQMDDEQRLGAADKARQRTLRFHTASVRAHEFESYARKALERMASERRRSQSAALI